MILTGDAVDAHRAYEMGLINHVVPATELLSTALELAVRTDRSACLSRCRHPRPQRAHRRRTRCRGRMVRNHHSHRGREERARRIPRPTDSSPDVSTCFG
ncbi:enoyl-CoA hydratase/isomerase family protein [Rhodococcus sp. B50]|uniref:enoyl-CoA hydratase/isomerase family protein n=1 Tax=Rhodococcus sp. B50 TaxID=2682847 RepID=UPI001BD2DB86|nr:hypothetical protein [Rhodococcus sp. B50]